MLACSHEEQAISKETYSRYHRPQVLAEEVGLDEANRHAKVIAAAPDLYAVVRAVVKECESTFVDQEEEEMAPEWVTILQDARAALARATYRSRIQTNS